MPATKFNLVYLDPSATDRKDFARSVAGDFEVHLAGTPEEAKKILRKIPVQLIVSEQKLPGTTGVAFLKAIGKGRPNLVRAIVSDFKRAVEVIHALNTYAVHKFIIKPWQDEALRDLLHDALQIHIQKKKNRQVLVDLQHLLDEMNLVHQVSMQISEKKPLGKLLKEIMEGSKAVMNAEASSLLLYDPDDKSLHFQVATGEKGTLVKKFSVGMGEGIAGWVAKHRQPQLIENCYEDPRFNPSFDERTRFRTRSMICVPLVRKNKLLGVIQVINKKDGEVFSEADLRIFSTLASQCAISIENAKLIDMQIESEALERELETAREIQNQLLPAELPTYGDLDIDVKLIPARLVGGDYYHILRINDRQSLFFIADVSGKGVPAALIVSTIFSCLETYLNLHRNEFDLLTLVSSMNEALISSTTLDKYATGWFGFYDHKTRRLMSINAGHNPPYIFRKRRKAPIELNTGGIFMGIMNIPFEYEEVVLQADDVLAVFTDGVTEAWNKREEDYGEPRLVEIINRVKSRSASEILSAIWQDVNQHVNGAPQSDDFTCAVIKFVG